MCFSETLVFAKKVLCHCIVMNETILQDLLIIFSEKPELIIFAKRKKNVFVLLEIKKWKSRELIEKLINGLSEVG